MWKLRAEGGSQIGHCNITCVIHVTVNPHQQAMRLLMYHFLQVGLAAALTRHKFVHVTRLEGLRSDILH